MDTITILRSMFGIGKHSTIEVSRAMGRSRGFISAYLAKGNSPSADLLSEICDAIDYDLLMRNRKDGSEIIIGPPDK